MGDRAREVWHGMGKHGIKLYLYSSTTCNDDDDDF